MFKAIMTSVTAIGNAVKGVTNVIVGRQEAAKREEQRDAGRTESERNQLEAGHEARERMDAVDSADSDTVDRELRSNDY